MQKYQYNNYYYIIFKIKYNSILNGINIFINDIINNFFYY